MISVIIPAYDRTDALIKVLDAYRNQTYKDFEIIVVDDCSPHLKIKDYIEKTDFDYSISYYR